MLQQKILCVDSEPLNLQLLELVLKKQEYTVIKATDGDEALNYLQTQAIDLVILDASITKVNSFEVCKGIKEDRKFKNIPVIMIINLGLIEDRIRAMRTGADDIITKPFDIIEVTSKVNKLLKIKELDDKLCYIHSNLTTLATYSEEMFSNFDPFRFDLVVSIETFVSKILRQAGDINESPGFVLVCIMNGRNKRKWYYYEYSGQRLKKTLLALDIGWRMQFPDNNSAESYYYNEESAELSQFKPLFDELKAIDINVSNMVGYFSQNLYVAVLNYGRKVTEYDALILKNMVMQGQFFNSVSSKLRDSKNILNNAVHILSHITEADYENSESHVTHVSEISAFVAKKLGMPESFIRSIRLQAGMHDIGNSRIPSHILHKPDKLSDVEFTIVKNHTLYGAALLEKSRGFEMARNISIAHHERWDGSGYPCGLKNSHIPIEGRIVHLADLYDTLRSRKVYRSAYDHDKAYRIITEGDGRTMPYHFDPEILNVFKENTSKFNEIYSGLTGQPGKEV